MTELWFATMNSPVGTLTIEATPKGIAAITFEDKRRAPTLGAPGFLDACTKQLQEYFDGRRRAFHDLPLVLRGTDFQTKVWDEVLKLHFGATTTYGGLAKRMGEESAARAVGNALNRNPVCIIVPCHRIVGANEDSGGYAGGMDRKTWLLTHERTAPDTVEERCPVCSGALIERKLKKHCVQCGVLCETCCDGGAA